MNVVSLGHLRDAGAQLDAWGMLDVLPDAILIVGEGNILQWANNAAEQLFGLGRSQLVGRRLDDLLGANATLSGLCASVAESRVSLREHELELTGRPPLRSGVYDVQIAADAELDGTVLVSLRERGLSSRLGELNHQRGAARSLAGFAASLAHEVKNPLSGIRGAAQLLETAVEDTDKDLAQLIANEVDRICALLERMEAFSDRHPMPLERLNIHEVLDHVARLARTGVAAHLSLKEAYDPSLPEIDGNRDALIQVFLNLVKNAAEACGEDGEITLATAYDGSVRHTLGSNRDKVLLPLTVTVSDNGAGIPAAIRDHLFEPFVSGSETRSGLGLSLVAKMVDNHGGTVSVVSEPGATQFRVSLPLAASGAGR
jgi:two-component system nitrogen regulation sensor histidine kinase GlnL